MPNSVQLIGSKNLIAKFAKKIGGAKNASVIVGYTANYAMPVHEMIPTEPQWGRARASGKGHYWDPSGRGQPKFLEQPLREMQTELVTIVQDVYEKTDNLMSGLFIAGLRLQRESQRRVPVDTGNLKSSAFTRKE